MKIKIINICKTKCPENIFIVKKILDKYKKKIIFCIISDDLSSLHEIPNFCFLMNFHLLKIINNKIPYRFYIKKKIY